VTAATTVTGTAVGAVDLELEQPDPGGAIQPMLAGAERHEHDVIEVTAAIVALRCQHTCYFEVGIANAHMAFDGACPIGK
jgi:hypothetical protein